MEQSDIDVLVRDSPRPPGGPTTSGLDGVEVDAGSISLLRQFHSGLTNLRADRYGSDRLALTVEVLQATRDALGPDGVLSLRLSCDELAPWAGVTPDQARGQVPFSPTW